MNGLGNIQIRNGIPDDHQKIISVMPEWWGGRDLSSNILKIFFIHFSNTIFIAEINRSLVGFLIGFFSQSDENVGYIHFVGVHPDHRKVGIGRLLYNRFYQACLANQKLIVKSCTSPVNKLSLQFHEHMGFEIEPGDAIVDGLPVTMNFLRNMDPKVLFIKRIG